MGQLAEAPCFQCPAHLLNGHIEAVLMTGTDLYILLRASSDNFVRVLHGHGNGLFHDYIDAVVDAVQRNLRMDTAFRGNGHQLQVGMLFNHLPVVGVALGGPIIAGLFKQKVDGLRVHITDGNHVQVVVYHRLDVIHRDSAAANECVFHFYLPLQVLILIGPQFSPPRGRPQRDGKPGLWSEPR